MQTWAFLSQVTVLKHLTTAQGVRMDVLFLWDRLSLWMHILIPEGHAQRCKPKINQAAKPALGCTAVTDDAISAWLAVNEVS